MLYRFTDHDGREVHFTAVPYVDGGTRIMLSIYRAKGHHAIIHTCIDLKHDEALQLAGSIKPAYNEGREGE
jgi:hypothetical protein